MKLVSMNVKKILPALALALALTAPLALLARAEGDAPSGGAAAQAITTDLVYGLLSDSDFAYRQKPLNDALSQEVFKRYLETLDASKLFFTAQDVAKFTRYQTTLDDAIKGGELEPARTMFTLFKQRVNERVAYARGLLKGQFDFSGNDRYEYDREDAPWAADSAALDVLWKQSVKNDWLRLKLAGKKPDEIRKTLDKRYAEIVKGVAEWNDEDAFSMFINAYTSSIDPHTDYMNPRAAANFDIQVSNTLIGIGAVLQKQDEFVVIRELIPGGPAALSGKLKSGDRVVAVGQGDSGAMEDVVDRRIDDVVAKIRGKEKTTVRLDIVPAEAGIDSKPSRIVLVRNTIRIEDGRAKAETITIPAGGSAPAKRIGVIKLPGFYLDFDRRRGSDGEYASATRDVAKLLLQLRAEKVDGVVLDLRNNGGGSLDEAIELTGLFIDKGPVVQVREVGGQVDTKADVVAGVAWDGPLAVLINRGSASASEIFAGAIQDYGRGLVIGETTFGKGTVQNLLDLNRFSRDATMPLGKLKHTVAQFFRVNGGSTQHKGVVPDIRYPVTVDASEFGESTYDNALPWSQIAAVGHVQYGNFASLLPRLDALHAARIAGDKEFQWWAEDVAQFRAEKAKKFLSLNEGERRAERDKFDALRKRRQAERVQFNLELDPIADEDALDDGLQSNERNVAADAAREKAAEKRPDPLLRESAAILADAVTLLTADRKLATQVLPAAKVAGHWAD